MIINDCYNASPTSIKSALDILSLYQNEKVCILGDMAEIGEFADKYYREISEYVNGRSDKLIAIGKYRNEYCINFNSKENCFLFEDVEEFEKNIKSILNGNETVLVKASRSAKLERVVESIKNIF